MKKIIVFFLMAFALMVGSVSMQASAVGVRASDIAQAYLYVLRSAGISNNLSFKPIIFCNVIGGAEPELILVRGESSENRSLEIWSFSHGSAFRVAHVDWSSWGEKLGYLYLLNDGSLLSQFDQVMIAEKEFDGKYIAGVKGGRDLTLLIPGASFSYSEASTGFLEFSETGYNEYKDCSYNGKSISSDEYLSIQTSWKQKISRLLISMSGGTQSDEAMTYSEAITYLDGIGSFFDVKPGSYYANAVDWAVNKGITDGTAIGFFSPSANCTRAQAVTFLWRAAGSPTPASNYTPFKDVQRGSYYEKAVLWALERGITGGTSTTAFSPNSPCTRSQIVTFLYRMAGSPGVYGSTGFVDVKPGKYYEKAVVWAVQHKITEGTTASSFSPDNNCTRAQIVTFLYRDMA